MNSFYNIVYVLGLFENCQLEVRECADVRPRMRTLDIMYYKITGLYWFPNEECNTLSHKYIQQLLKVIIKMASVYLRTFLSNMMKFTRACLHRFLQQRKL